MKRFKIIRGGRSAKRRRSELTLGLATFLGVLILGIGVMFAPQADVAEARDTATITQPRVIDGDTIEDLATGERIRLANIDTPEIRDGAHCAAERRHGERARSEVRLLLARANEIALRRTGREDDYGRTIAYVLIDGQDLGRMLVAEGLARPWRGRREPWCGAGGALLR